MENDSKEKMRILYGAVGWVLLKFLKRRSLICLRRGKARNKPRI